MLLFKYKWLIPVLAEMFPSGGAKYITLVQRYGMSRSMLTASLKHLIHFGLVKKNLGHGHPLRPEYILTTAGSQVAPFCYDFMKLLKEQKQSILLQNRWACPVIFHTGDSGKRFNEYKRALPPITPRALSESLQFLVNNQSLKRNILPESPPISLYSLPKKTIKLYKSYWKHEASLSSWV